MGAIVAHLRSGGQPDAEVLRRMLATTPHRGTVQEFLTHGACALGISYSEDWHDASLASEGGLAAAVYGPIDNLDDLSRTLLGTEAARAPGGPAGVLLAAFRAYRDAAPGHLRGVFGALVTDGTSLWCFRDHLGYAPLYYRDDAKGLLVGTEAKQIVAGSGIRAEPDPDVFEAIFYSAIPDEMSCPLRGVRRVPQRKVLVASPSGIRSNVYWEPESLLESARYSPGDLKDRFEQLMTQAVGRMMTPGTLLSLSGGIDSPAVAAFAAPEYLRRMGRPLPALSVVYPGFPTIDERRYVELVAGHLGMPLHMYETRARPLDGLEHWVQICDSPVLAESVAHATELFTETRKLGARTILSGDIAEFVFDMGQKHLLSHLVFRGRFSAVRHHLSRQRARGASATSLAKQLIKVFAPDFVMDARERASYRPHLPDWVDHRRMERVATPLPPRRNRWRHWQVGVLSFPNLSAESEAISQALCGVTVRRPWGDVDLWEFFLSLPAETKFPDLVPRKLLVRGLLKGRVPDAILTRVKQYYDELALATVDYPLLQRLLTPSTYRMPGVNYERLAERLRNQELGLVELPYAYGLAAAHAFVEQLANGDAVERPLDITA